MSSCCHKLGKINWILARISAVFILIYFVLLTKVWLVDQPVGYIAWKAALLSSHMKISFILALAAIFFHAWIGIWTILTDYIKCKFMQQALHLMTLIALLITVTWGISIVGFLT